MWISLDMGTLSDIVPFLHAFACCCSMTLHKMTSNVIVLLSGGLEMKHNSYTRERSGSVVGSAVAQW